MHHQTSRSTRRMFGAALLAPLAIAIGACADLAPTGTASRGAPVLNIEPPVSRPVEVCKVGPAGNYQFTISDRPDVINTAAWTGTLLVNTTFTVAAGTCVTVFMSSTDIADELTIREVNIPEGISLEKIVIESPAPDTCETNPTACAVTVTGQTHITFESSYAKAWKVTFHNVGEVPPPPPQGANGCTPGFWKNHPEFWVGYTTGQDFDAVFGVDIFSTNRTLLAALQNGGGGYNAFARHATAALLNASHPDGDYGLTPAQVIAMVQSAVANGTIEATKDQLDAWNNRGCSVKD